jgi:hypothetical protein
MPEEFDWLLEARNVKPEIGIGINDELNRGAFAFCREIPTSSSPATIFRQASAVPQSSRSPIRIRVGTVGVLMAIAT